MESATAPGRNYAAGMQALGSSLVTAAGSLAGGMEAKAANKEAAPTLMSQYEQMSKATGQEMDPTIIDRFSKLGDMSGSQLAQFNKDVTSAQQNALTMANIQRQQALFEMQQQAAARAAQNSNVAQYQNWMDNMINARNANISPYSPQAQ